MASPYLKIGDLRGGVNDSDSPFSLLDTEVVAAVNVDYRAGQIGTKRGGTNSVALTGSVFTSNVPIMAQRTMGGFTGAANGNLAIGANGSSNADMILIVRTAITAGTVTGITFGGVALTQHATLLNGNRVDVWFLRNPSIGAQTLTVTLSGAADCSIICERWTSVNTAASPEGSATHSATSTTPQPSSNAYNAQRMVLNALSHNVAASIAVPTVGVMAFDNNNSGNARLAATAIIGMKPTSQFNFTLSGSVAWESLTFALIGSANGVGTPLIWLGRFQPTNTLTDDELWAQDAHGRLDRRVNGTWQAGVPVQNYSVGSFISAGYGTNAVSLHGKYFLSLRGTTYADRTHVWTGSVLRWAGFGTPSALTSVANTAPAGTFSGVRYYRYRNVEQVAGVVVRRSEPSVVTSFTPSGANTGAVLTRPADGGFISGEGATHWEVEASLDNNLFYRVASVAIGTTTYTDTASSYTTNPLSEALTEYIPLPQVNHLVVDEDRLLGGGSTYSANNDSRVVWTPLRGDLGAGNDERVPATSRFYRDLDGLNGGGLTMLTPAVLGGIHAFKSGRIYKLVRTGKASGAYDSIMLTPARGTVLRCAHDGTDENGYPCTYFYDPNVGGCRLGKNGIEDLMQKRRALVQRVYLAANYTGARVLFYPLHWLVWYALSIDGSSTPNYLACFNIRTKSWTDYTGPMATFLSGVLFPNSSHALRPLIAPVTLGTSAIVEADNGVNDDGVRFRGYVRTRAYVLGELFSEFEIDGSVLHAKASAADIQTSAIRDLGLEQKNAEPVSIAAVGSESYVTVASDDLDMAELEQVQFEVGDPASYSGSQLDQAWRLEALTIKRSSGSEVG